MSIRSFGWRSVLIGAVLPTLVCGAVLAAVWSELPSAVATHWGPSGVPDGFLQRSAGLVVALIGLPLLTWAVLVAVVAAVPPSAPGVGILQGLPAGMSWFVFAVVTLATAAQQGATAPTPMQGWWLAAAVTAGAAGTTLSAVLAGPPPPLPRRTGAPAPTAPRLPDGADGALVWTGEAPTAMAMVWSAVGLIALGFVLSWALDVWLLVLFLPIALLLVASARARVTIGARRVVVAGGLAGWPRLSLPLDTVAQATTTTTGIWEWGGWGLRVVPGATGVITPAGPALELQRTDSTRVVITVEDPDTAAAVINTLLDDLPDAG